MVKSKSYIYICLVLLLALLAACRSPMSEAGPVNVIDGQSGLVPFFTETLTSMPDVLTTQVPAPPLPKSDVQVGLVGSTRPVAVAVSPTTSPNLRLAVTPELVSAGQQVTVSWEDFWGGCNGECPVWISLHPVDTPHSSYMDWQYANGASGSLTFDAPWAAGRYEFRLFDNGAHIATSNAFVVTDVSPNLRLAVTPESVSAGQQVTVSWENFSGGCDGCPVWISLHPVDTPHSSYMDWQYASGASGSLTFDAPQTAGRYEFRLFDNGAHIATSNAFVVTDVSPTASPILRLVVTPESVSAGQQVTVSWENFSGGCDGCPVWISLHPVDTPHSSYMDWKYAGGASGSLTFDAPQTAGRYEFRLFDNGVHVATSNSFDVP